MRSSAVRPVAACLAAVALEGCSWSDSETDRRPSARPAQAAPRSVLAARRTEVRFPTADGVLLSGSLTTRPRRSPAVVLVHHFGSDRHDWDGFVIELDRAGFATLAYDARGMGGSLSRWPSKERYLPPGDEDRYLDAMPRDVAAALRFLRNRPQVDPRRIAVVGASHGANVAYASSAAPRAARATVALSPVLLRDALRPRRSPRGVLFVSSRLEAAAVLELAPTVTEPSRTLLARRPEGHGVALLAERGVRRAVLGWLRERLGPD